MGTQDRALSPLPEQEFRCTAKVIRTSTWHRGGDNKEEAGVLIRILLEQSSSLTDSLWLQVQNMAPLYMKDQQASCGQDLLEAGPE